MALTGSRRRSIDRAAGAAGWRPGSGWAALVVGFVLVVAGRSIIGDGRDPRLAVVADEIVLTVVPIAVVVLLARWQGDFAAADFGLRRPPLLRAAALVMATGVALFALTVLSVVAFGLGDEAPDAIDRLAAHGPPNALLVIVLVAVAAPLGEEFLFRGFLFRVLRNRWRVAPAALVSSAVFMAFHIGWVPPVVLVLAGTLGVGTCLLYHWTGSLYPGLVLHALLNSSSIGTVPAWSWPLPLTMTASVVVTLAAAGLIARLLGPAG
ncbi:hypothetical protein BH20ACT2_BH20ACT2_04440 [soil metagenome]